MSQQFLLPWLIGNGIFSADQIHHLGLREWLELDPLEVAEESLHLIQTLGLEDFEYILSLTAPDTRLGILGILAGFYVLGTKIDCWKCSKLVFTLLAKSE